MSSSVPPDFNPYQAPAEASVPLTEADLERLKSIPWVRAPLWRRLLAAVVDLLIGFGCATLGFVLLALIFVFAFNPERMVLNGPQEDILYVVSQVLLLLCTYGMFFAYFVLMESSRFRGTLGKYWLGLAVVHTNGRRISRWRALFRTMVKTIGTLFYGVGLIWMFFNRHRQALHDRAADTVVVLRDEGDSA